MTAAQVLLCRCIDFAGMFPPASFDLEAAVERFRAYREGGLAWALGTLVLPVHRLTEFQERWPQYASQWPIAIVVKGDVEAQLEKLLQTASKVPPAAVECGAVSPDHLKVLIGLLPSSTTLYIEIDPMAEMDRAFVDLAAAGAKAKIRTGGLVDPAIPPAEHIARFIQCSVQHGVPFKATAGLHHAVRGVHSLTYEAESPRARMHGFLNVLLASALLSDRGTLEDAIELLEESSVHAFQFEEGHVRWRKWSFTVQQLAETRKNVMQSFGSCSFTEPLGDLQSAGFIQ